MTPQPAKQIGNFPVRANIPIRETQALLASRPLVSCGLGHRALLELLAASEEIRKALRTRLAHSGLTLEGFQVLAALHQDPVSATPTLLAKKIKTSQTVLSHTLNRLEFSRLLARQRGGKDRRMVQVQLTPLGQSTVKKASIACNQAVRQLVSMFDERALKELVSSCTKLCQGALALN